MDNEEFEVISRYTDDQAVEDGFLVKLGRGNDRVTNAMFAFLAAAAPADTKPPNRWPVDLMGWFKAKDENQKALALAGGVVSTNSREAKRVYEQNIGGGIFKVYAKVGLDGKLAELTTDPKDGEVNNKVLWLVPNELGGITLMFPEDY